MKYLQFLLLSGLLLGFWTLGVPAPAVAQDDNPFAVDEDENADSPFLSVDEAPPSDNEPENNPFSSQSPSPDNDDPFAVEVEKEEQSPPENDSPFTGETMDSDEPANPFDIGTSVDSSDTEAEEPENPFAQESSQPAAPSGPDPENPFSQAAPDTGIPDPFAEPSTFEQSTSPFEQSGPMEQPMMAEPQQEYYSSQSPMPVGMAAAATGRPELRYADPRLRRLAEIRGVYVLATDDGIQNATQLKQFAKDFAVGDFNRAYIEARTVYGVAYMSDLEPQLPYISLVYPNPIQDLKEDLGDFASTFAVINVYQAYNAAVGSRPPLENPISRFPEFTNRSINGETIASDNYYYLDPGNPLVRQYVSAVIYEIETKVQPTGYLLRGLRYPGKEWGYSPLAVAAFRKEVGGEGDPPPDDPVWCAWRRQQIADTILSIRETLALSRPDVPVGVLIEVDGRPPTNWNQWTGSNTYAEKMQDWIGWCSDGLISELVFEIHERVRPGENVLHEWLPVINSNVGDVRPVISLAGNQNLRTGLSTQYESVRQRAIGTILYNYADPARDFSRGFFASIKDGLFSGAPGNPIGSRKLTGPQEARMFAKLNTPPPGIARATPTPTTEMNPLAGKNLVFTTPTPIPTQTPVTTIVPESIERIVTLRNGMEFKALILEVSPNSVTLKAIDNTNSSPVIFSRSAIRDIQPPI